jgi:hypothetical protein
MTKQKAARNVEKVELLPPDEAKQRTDELLRRMLNSPPQPHAPKATKKKAKRAK